MPLKEWPGGAGTPRAMAQESPPMHPHRTAARPAGRASLVLDVLAAEADR